MKTSFKVSRKSFIGNYFISIAILFLMLLLDIFLGIPNIIFFVLISFAFYFLLEPEFSLIYYKYEIDNEKITQTRGIISKKIEIIPWRLVSKVELKQGILARIFGYGNIFVSDISEATGITIKGISKPGKVLQLIEEKISNVKA